MKYQMELEVEIADNKISFTEESFKSIPFVKKVMTIAPETKKRFGSLKSITPRAGCMQGTFTWMSDDFNAPVDVFNEYQ
jgi:hypothetical protein